MVEIVNPQDADLLARAEKACAPCGSCDFGLVEYGCSCGRGEDPRQVIVDLLREREKWGERAALLSASTMGEAFDRLEELVAAEKRVARLEKALACPECGAQGRASCVVKGTTLLRSRHMSRIVVDEEDEG